MTFRNKRLLAAYETYQRNLQKWIRSHDGEWVLLRDRHASFHADYESALSAGYKQFGLGDFFVKQVRYPEEVIRVYP